VKNFEEAKFRAIFDWQIMRQVSGYSGWNLFANTAIALVTQGTTILLNMFFNPSVVAGRAIANQVNAAAGRFVSSFRTAANPQIVKKYAAGDKEGSKELLIRSTVFSYYIMWVLILPLLFVSDTLLQLWLGQIPDYSIPFLQLTLVTSLFQVFDSSLYMALYAKGQIKENAMLSPTMGFISFGVMYLFFKLGFSPISLGWILLIDYAIIGVVIKPILAIKIVDYTMNDMVRIFLPCVKVTLMSLPIPLVIFCYRELIFANDILSFIGLTMVSVLSVCITVWYIGLDEALRNKLLNSAKFRIQKLKLKK
jgi:O-antigen/teichoic acid export membrane protein